MLTRRGLASCALCAVAGFVATAVDAEAPAPAGVKREILKRMEGPTPEFETIIASADIQPGFRVARHIHPGIESAYIVGGSAVLSIDGIGDIALTAGEVAQVPARRPHSLTNGDRPMKIIATYVLEKGQPIAIPVPE